MDLTLVVMQQPHDAEKTPWMGGWHGMDRPQQAHTMESFLTRKSAGSLSMHLHARPASVPPLHLASANARDSAIFFSAFTTGTPALMTTQQLSKHPDQSNTDQHVTSGLLISNGCHGSTTAWGQNQFLCSNYVKKSADCEPCVNNSAGHSKVLRRTVNKGRLSENNFTLHVDM